MEGAVIGLLTAGILTIGFLVADRLGRFADKNLDRGRAESGGEEPQEKSAHKDLFSGVA